MQYDRDAVPVSLAGIGNAIWPLVELALFLLLAYRMGDARWALHSPFGIAVRDYLSWGPVAGDVVYGLVVFRSEVGDVPLLLAFGLGCTFRVAGLLTWHAAPGWWLLLIGAAVATVMLPGANWVAASA